MIICANSHKPMITSAVINEPSRRLLARLNAVHHANPQVDHLYSLGSSTEVAHILIYAHVIVVWAGRFWSQGCSLNVVTDRFEVFFLLGSKLRYSMNYQLTKGTVIRPKRDTYLRHNSIREYSSRTIVCLHHCLAFEPLFDYMQVKTLDIRPDSFL